MSEKLTRQEIEHLAKLSRLELDEKEVEKYQKELSQILTYISQIESFVKGKKIEGKTRGQSKFREDKVEEKFSRDEMLKNAPSEVEGLVKVPRVFE